MAIAHVCMQCGLDLARVRALKEPRYGLPLVICPRCRYRCVRREHPIWTGYKQFRRVFAAMSVMFIQIVLIATFAVLTTLAVFALMMMMIGAAQNRTADVPWILVMCLIVLPVFVGAWLTVSFSHIKRWRVWCGWFVFMLLPLLGLGVTLFATDEFRFGVLMNPQSVAEKWMDGFLAIGLFCAACALPLLAIMIIAPAGIPLGHALLWALARLKHAEWRWRRRMLRRRRYA